MTTPPLSPPNQPADYTNAAPPPPVQNEPQSQAGGGEAADKPTSDAEKILQNLSGKFNAKNLTIAGVVQGSISQQFSDEGRANKLTLMGHFDVFKEDRLREERSRLHFDPDVVNRLAFRLQERRILILAGEPEMGKASLALLISSALLWTNLRSSTAKPLQEAALCRYIPAKLCVDFTDLAGREDDFQQRILILKNAFSSNNEDILNFATQLSDSQLQSYVSKLRDSNSFLILTADISSLPVSREKLKGLGILEDVPKPLVSDLEEGLRHLVRRWIDERKIPADDPDLKKVETLIAEKSAILAAELGSLSRLARFVREYLLEVAQEPARFQDALKQTTDISHWLLGELSGDPETWCAVVALTLGSADRSLEGVPWFEFEALKRALFHFAGRELHPNLRRRKIQDLCRTELTLKRARAEVVPASYPRREVIRFCDERHSDLLWQTLLGPGRGVASGLVPLLRQLTLDKDYYLRQSAAQALGRIGRIDPFYITYPLINEWAAPDDRRNKLECGNLLGALFEGIWSAREDSDYQQGCLRVLRAKVRSASSRTVEVALFSLYQIATIDREGFELAWGMLKEIVERRLRIDFKTLHEVTKEYRTDEQFIRLVESVFQTRGELDEVRKKVELALHALAVAESEIIDAFGFTLLRLLLWNRHQGETLRRILDWVQTNPDHCGPLMALLFLGNGGISTWLEWNVSGRKSVVGDEEEGSPLLELSRHDADLAKILAALVEALFLHIRAFPGLLLEALERNFLRLLANWAREARTITHLRDTVTGLLASLYASRNEELSERILRLAQEPAASPEFEDLRVLAIEAITGRRSSRSSVDGPRELSV